MTAKTVPMALAVTLCLAAFPAGGQTVRTQSGHALDANTQIGSGGYNTPVAGPGAINSQLYITGQTTGLSRFRGGVPYDAPDQLGIVPPSTDLDTFRQESVGLSEVLSGSTYLPAPYYRRTRTAFGVRGITAGATMPGSNVPIRPTLTPILRRKLYQQVTTPYESIVPPVPRTTTMTGSLLDRDRRLVSPTSSVTGQEISRPGADAIFAVAGARQRQHLVEELHAWTIRRRQAEEEDEQDAPPLEELRSFEALDQPEPIFPYETPEPDTDRPALPTGTGLQRPEGSPPPGEDIYIDLLIRLRQQQMHGQSPTELLVKLPEETESFAPPTPQAAESLRKEALTTTPLLPDTIDQQEFPTSPITFDVAQDVVIVHGLAGAGPDLFNQYMTLAQGKLQSGNFYEAADQFELAVTVAPDNPLGRVGLGVARFAAGEPLTASLQFRRALQMLPPLMETRVDITSLLPEKVIEIQLQRAEKILNQARQQAENSERPAAKFIQPEIAFLVTFLNHNLGRTEQATQYAEFLKEATVADTLMQAYAEYVLAGQHPMTEQGE